MAKPWSTGEDPFVYDMRARPSPLSDSRATAASRLLSLTDRPISPSLLSLFLCPKRMGTERARAYARRTALPPPSRLLRLPRSLDRVHPCLDAFTPCYHRRSSSWRRGGPATRRARELRMLLAQYGTATRRPSLTASLTNHLPPSLRGRGSRGHTRPHRLPNGLRSIRSSIELLGGRNLLRLSLTNLEPMSTDML